MIKILIHPEGKILKDGTESLKNYPYFNEMISKLKNNFENIEINQLGSSKDRKLENIDNYFFDLKLMNLKNLINEHDLWISIDSFLPHYCNCYDLKPGIVIFNISNPDVFGYKQNVNLIKNRKYIRKNQFHFYKKEDYEEKSFIDSNILFETIKEKIYEN